MNTGKLVRMSRLFSHRTGRFCSVAVDHFIGCGGGLPCRLRQIQRTLAAIAAEEPDAVTMHNRVAAVCWAPHAGHVPLILQSTIATEDRTVSGIFSCGGTGVGTVSARQYVGFA